MDIQVLDMRQSDLAAVWLIEKSVQDAPWSLTLFEESLSGLNLCRLIKSNNKVVAFHVVSPILDELHLLNFAVDKNSQGQGLGHALMHDVIEIAGAGGADKVFLEVRASNLVAQSLYKKWQFEKIAIRKNYYRTTTQTAIEDREDAVIMLRKS